MTSNVILDSELTCPKCGHKKLETMPTDACRAVYLVVIGLVRYYSGPD